MGSFFFCSEPHKSDVEIFSLINCTLWSPKTKKWGFTFLIKKKELTNLNFLFKEGAIPCPCHSLESLPDPSECGEVERSACLSCEACWLVGKEGCVWSGCSSHQCPETPGQACSLVAWESPACSGSWLLYMLLVTGPKGLSWVCSSGVALAACRFSSELACDSPVELTPGVRT